MRRITLTFITTLAILVLLFSYRTSRDQPVTAATVAVGSAHVVSTPSTSNTTGAPNSTGAPITTAAPATSSRAVTATVDGSAVSTPYGDVQVEVVIAGGKITEVKALEYPNQERRDQQINDDALPQLQAQVLQAQSANIAGVSGATFTTQGYVTSLQSALDSAKF